MSRRPLAPIALAATLHDPAGDLLGELRRAIPALRARYARVAVSTSPGTAAALVATLQAAGMYAGTPAANQRGPLYRLCLRRALGAEIERVHYLDCDRALHWLAVAPAELDAILRRARRVPALLIGRTLTAHRSHHRPLYSTETVVNRVFAERLGFTGRVDFCVPSFVLCRADVRALLARSHARDASVYGEWAALLATVPQVLHYTQAHGLDWETPDRDPVGVRRLGRARWRARFETPAEWGLRVSMSAAFLRGFERVLARSRRRATLRRR